MDSKDILRRVGETLNRKNEDSKRDKEQTEKERREVVSGVAQDVANAIKPYLEGMAQRAEITKEDLKAALSEVQINIPESNVHIPEFKIPTPQVTVNVPEAKMPQVNIPATVFPDKMDVGLGNYSNKTPMPVMLMDTTGKPFVFSFPTSTGGKNDFFTVKGITNTIASNVVDSSGVSYSGSNPVPITVVSGALTSTIVVGSVVADAVDDGSAPVQGGGIARTANPTPVAANDVVKSTHDDLGRQVIRPLQVRDLTLTAYVAVSNGTETTLRAAVAGAYLDVIMLKFGNTSDAAVSVDVRAVTAGNIVDTVVVPPYGTAGYSSTVPYPAGDTGNNWTIDLPDITGTTVYATALFSQEV